MIEELTEIYKGHATVIKSKEYLKPEEYISPFVDKLKNYTPSYLCFVKVADQLSKDDDINTVYNKVLIIARFPDSYDVVTPDGYKYHRVVCMAYALDVRTPVCKFYTGAIDSDMNFYAFGANCMNIQEIEDGFPLDYSFVDTIVRNGLADNCLAMLSQFSTIELEKDTMQNTLGEWVDFTIKKEYVNDSGRVKLSPNMAIDAYKSLVMDKESGYYSDLPTFNMHTIYKSWASQVTEDDKDIMNRYEKTQLINNVLKL